MELKLKRISFKVGTTIAAKFEVEDVTVFKESPTYYHYMLKMQREEPVEKRIKKVCLNTDRNEGRFSSPHLISKLYLCLPEEEEAIKKQILEQVSETIAHQLGQVKAIEDNFKKLIP